MTTARQLFKCACDEAVTSPELRGGINRLHRSKKFAHKSGSSKPQPAVVAWQYFAPLLPPFAGHCCGGVSCARLPRMPANSASLAC